MSELTTWVRDILIIVISLTFIEILIPEGSMEKYLRFIFSLIILAVILQPIMKICNI